MKKSVLASALFLAAVSSAFADDGILYDCSLANSNRIGIPENRTTMRITTANRKGERKLQILVTGNMGRGRSRVSFEAVVVDVPSMKNGSEMKGKSAAGDTVDVTIAVEPKSGRIGIPAPRYTIWTTIGKEEEETWSCWSPRDPQ